MLVVQNGLTRLEDHRPVVPDQSGEARLGHLVVPAHEPLQELPVGELAHRSRLENRLDVLEKRVLAFHHAIAPVVEPAGGPPSCSLEDNVLRDRDCSQFILS